MPDLLSQLLSIPSYQPPAPRPSNDLEYEDQLSSLAWELKQTPSSKLVADTRSGSLLDGLEPSGQSLAYLFVLLAHYQEAHDAFKTSLPQSFCPGGTIWRKSTTFLKEFDPIQVEYARPQLYELVELVANVAELTSRPLLAIHPIKEAILRLDPSASTFTSSHTVLMRLCLRARSYLAALPILRRDICQFAGATENSRFSRRLRMGSHGVDLNELTSGASSGKLTHRDYLEYFMYGSMIFLGLKKYDEALHLLELIISVPSTNSVSAIMVEAYKKWVLASLLEKGEALPIPACASPSAARAYRSLAKPYDALADVFKAGDLGRLQAEIDAGMPIWRNDNNTGLVMQTISEFVQFSVLKLDGTFAAISIAQCGVPVNHGEKESFITSLISEGKLPAQLVQSGDPAHPTILRFPPSTSISGRRAEASFDSLLMTQKARLSQLVKDMKASDLKLQLGREYMEWSRKMSARGEHDSSGRNGTTEAGEGFSVDEDIMAEH